MRLSTLSQIAVVVTISGLVAGCPGKKEPPTSTETTPTPTLPEAGKDDPRDRPKLIEPVAIWKDGKEQGEVEAADAESEGYDLIDLGEDWTPYLFSEGKATDTTPAKPNAYRKTYLALAKGEFPNDHHGERARQDKYLELYGILPTLNLQKTRLEQAMTMPCAAKLDLEPLRRFKGFVSFEHGNRSTRNKDAYDRLLPIVEGIKKQFAVKSVDEIPVDNLTPAQQEVIEDFNSIAPEVEAIIAVQERLQCEGFFRGRTVKRAGVFDWVTHEALADFERKHRVFGWGFLGRDTLDELRLSPADVEHEALLRVLTERAMHETGIIEDGSVGEGDEAPTYVGEDGKTHRVPNLEAQLRERLISAFGLQTPESTLKWLKALKNIQSEHLVAFKGIEKPEYYSNNMDFSVTIDRGDVWYDFPYDQNGKSRSQPISRRPRTMLFTRYRDQLIPLAKYGTTIGGWRSDYVDGSLMWKYKNSPVGERVWKVISAAPVWLPPDSTPPKSLLTKGRNPKINYHETGPSYASAYGLVAAYHRKFKRESDGSISIWGDEGIRSHGSVDYMSIMRRQSHGCHRLHNHIAVRLMSFVLAHRQHRRIGQQALNFKRDVEYDGKTYKMQIDQGGYNYELTDPIVVNVLEGRIRGVVKNPIDTPLPKYEQAVGKYVMPNGQWVSVDVYGRVTPVAMPPEAAALVKQDEPADGESPNAETEADEKGDAGSDGLDTLKLKNDAPIHEQPALPEMKPETIPPNQNSNTNNNVAPNANPAPTPTPQKGTPTPTPTQKAVPNAPDLRVPQPVAP
ncbi:MAG: hypothetical protein R3A47_01585 [Polyangiales bacterium]